MLRLTADGDLIFFFFFLRIDLIFFSLTPDADVDAELRLSLLGGRGRVPARSGLAGVSRRLGSSSAGHSVVCSRTRGALESGPEVCLVTRCG